MLFKNNQKTKEYEIRRVHKEYRDYSSLGKTQAHNVEPGQVCEYPQWHKRCRKEYYP